MAGPAPQRERHWLGCAVTMKTLLLGALSLSLLGGCITHRHVPVIGSKKSAVKSSSSSCKPSQYWDGEMCRHKGQGKGARKHDG